VTSRFPIVFAAVAAFATFAGFALAATRDASACARGYAPCLPVRADLDCEQIPDAKKPVRVTGADRYRLDADRNGLGCETAGQGGGRQSPWGLILRKPPRKEATSANVGDTLTVVGWSPEAFAGERYRLCNVVKSAGSSRVTCSRDVGAGGRLRGTVQTFGTWRVRPDQGDGGVFKLTLRVNGEVRASDTVRLR
jgi:hypothetical protein